MYELENNNHKEIKGEKLDVRNVSSWRFRVAMKLNVELITDSVEVKGWENYYALPENIHPVIATTHLTDTDVQITAFTFSQVADIAVSSIKTNQQDKIIGKLISLAGRENFYDIANQFVDKKANFRLDATNFLAMVRAVCKKGKTMVIPSHSPHYIGYGNRVLPDNPGLAAVIVANLTDRVVLPVAVEIHTKGRVGMAEDLFDNVIKKVKGKIPKSTVFIAEPIFLDAGGIPEELITTKNEVLDALQIFNSHTRMTMTEEDRILSLETLRKLKKQGEIVMMAQSAELPKERRGIWHERLLKHP
jgi:hypothetical protein